MNPTFQFLPEAASTHAASVDHLYLVLVALTAVFAGGIFILSFYFAVRYRRRPGEPGPQQLHGNMKLEIVWTVIPLLITMVLFGWGASVFFSNSRVPADALEMTVVGKQWMWKIQHPEGRREINELHVPINRPVKLTMASEDVIHSFYVPAFRVKQDVVPGRLTTMWFEATRMGTYHLFCAEYCGTNHSGMIGSVVVMDPVDYQNWLSGSTGETPLQAGARLFEQLNCVNCHRSDVNRPGRGPDLVGLFGKPVKLEGGTVVTFDESYIRESILNPNEKTVSGFRQAMPTFQGQLKEEEVLELIAYIKSLTPPEVAPAPGARTR